MAIVSVDKIWAGESWSDDKEGARNYEEVYRVISDNANESPITIRAAAGIPLPWTTHPGDFAAVCSGRSARRVDESRLIWEVTVTYEYDPQEPEEPEENPLDRPPKIRWTSTLVNRPVVKDRDGDACVNSAGDYFDPPLEYDFPRWTANIQFNAAEVPPTILAYAGAINTASITIDGLTVDAERARIMSLDISEETAEEVNGDTVTYRSITMAVECRYTDDEGFDLEPLDQGFRVRNEDDELVDVLIADEDGEENRPTAPVLLDGAGAKLEDPSPETAVFLTFEMPRREDFTIFPGIS